MMFWELMVLLGVGIGMYVVGFFEGKRKIKQPNNREVKQE